MNIEVRNLSKTYPNGTQALRGVSLDIPMGMFGLLGPNGAGKSSLMRTIATLQEADSGSIRMGEVDVLRDKEVMRARLGYLPQAFGVYPGGVGRQPARAHRHPDTGHRPSRNRRTGHDLDMHRGASS